MPTIEYLTGGQWVGSETGYESGYDRTEIQALTAAVRELTERVRLLEIDVKDLELTR